MKIVNSSIMMQLVIFFTPTLPIHGESKTGQMEKIDLNNPRTVERITAEAVEFDKLEPNQDTKLVYHASGEKPYSGWVRGVEGREKILMEFKDGKPHGRLFAWDLKGRKLKEGTLKEGNLHVFQTEWHENGQKKSEGNYKNDSEDGVHIHWHDNGQKGFQGTFTDGSMKGVLTIWHKNGQKKAEGTFKDSKEDGTWTRWYDDGQMQSEESYKNGKGDGTSTFYDKQGGASKGTYKGGQKWNGVFVGWDLFLESSTASEQRTSEESYKDGKRDGPSFTWYENGQKHQDVTYAKGKIVSAKAWKPDGDECLETNVSDGNGTLVYYRSSGSERRRETYKEGIKVANPKKGSGAKNLLRMLELMKTMKKIKETRDNFDKIKGLSEEEALEKIKESHK